MLWGVINEKVYGMATSLPNEMLNSKLKILNSKQTQMSRNTKLKTDRQESKIIL